jgi:hypothetical protein
MTTKITEQNISQLANAGVNWQPVVTADGSTGLTAVAGRGYFIDTTSGAQTITLPTSPNVGDVVVLKDYARTWATNNVTIASVLLDGGTNAFTFSTSGQTVTLVRMDNTRGWSLINEDTTTGLGAEFVSATGGTVTESGDFKIHTFTGDGCFVVSSLGNPLGGPNSVDYLVVAGGGAGPTTGGGDGISGGGGAGGFRFHANPSFNPQSGPGAPLNAPAGITVTTTSYPVTVGSGGTIGGPVGGTPGNNSIFSTITSTGGGRGGRGDPNAGGQPGGSGGGSDNGTPSDPAGSGNTPPVAPPQGNTGGVGGASNGGGGGGAIAIGGNGQPTPGTKAAGVGGNGAGVTGFGTSGVLNCGQYYFAGGGGGGNGNAHPGVPGGAGGLGGGGNGISPAQGSGPAGSGTTNTGGGGGGASDVTPGGAFGGTGGSGIVVIRYKFQ